MENTETLSLAEKIKEAVRKAKEPFLEKVLTRNPHKVEITTADGEVTTVGDVMDKNPKGKPLDEFGREVFDPTPIAPPIGYVKQPSMFEQVRDMVRGEALRIYAESQDMESFEDADDFDIDDDYDPRTPYELNFEGTVEKDWERLKETPPPKPRKKNQSGDQPDSGIEAAQPPKSEPADKPAEPAPKAP